MKGKIMMNKEMMNNTSETTINLATYFKEARTELGSQIMQEYGLETSFIAVDFIDDFDYFDINIYMDEKLKEYAEANTAIYNSDLFKWFSNGNSCIRYVNEIIRYETSKDSDVSILDIIRMSMYREIYESINEFFDELKYCMVAKYLMKIGYSTIEESIFDDMANNLKQYGYITFDKLFQEALTYYDCTEDNCGTKCA